MKCKARIKRAYKHSKAECVWPNYKDWKKLPVCGGDVTVVLSAVDEPYYGGTSARFDVEWTCSRCHAPWVPTRRAFDEAVANSCVGNGIDVTAFVSLFGQQKRTCDDK